MKFVSSSPPHDLAPGRIRRRIRTATLGRTLEVHGVVDSTMDLARQAAARGAPDGHLVLADAQRAGRGRRGHRWHSPPGGDIYLTLLLRRLPAAPRHAPLLGLGAALALCEALETFGISPLRVKWPNDVLIGERKVAGLLLEGLGGPDPALLLGLGVNVVLRCWPPELRGRAVALAEVSDAPPERDGVLAAWLLHFERWRERILLPAGRRALQGALQERLAWRGRWVRCEETSGLLLGLDGDGALRLRTHEGPRRLLVGTLRLAEQSGRGAQAPGSAIGSLAASTSEGTGSGSASS